MPSLNIFPTRRTTDIDATADSQQEQLQLPPLAPAASLAQSAHNTSDSIVPSAEPGPFSPVAPAYSPITPRAQPALPAAYSGPPENTHDAPVNNNTPALAERHASPIANKAEYIAPPPPRPFSSEDSTDAIALRAAISSLQFQKKKAEEDIQALEKIRKQALDDPRTFTTELAAGRLKEQRPVAGNLQAILDGAESDDDDDDDDDDNKDLAKDTVMIDGNVESDGPLKSQSSRSASTSPSCNDENTEKVPPFGRIPGPQNVVRMPYINWEKYHVAGEALDSIHEQQRRWPGNFAYGTDRGREHTVAAPYSPWLDPLEGQAQQRWDGSDKRHDSLATPTTAVTPTVSEHPMETRRGGPKF